MHQPAHELSEPRYLATSFFALVREGPASVEVVVEHFAHRDARLIVPDGTAFGIAAHQELHKRFLDERHTLGDFEAVFERLLDIVG